MSKRSQMESAASMASATDAVTEKPAARPKGQPKAAKPEAASVAEERGLVAKAETRYGEADPAIIKPSPLNPRKRPSMKGLKELAISIVQKDLEQPITVRPSAFDPKKGPFAGMTGGEIIFGARRHAAFQMALEGVTDDEGVTWKLAPDTKIRLFIRHPTSDRDLVILAATENFDREDMDEVDEAFLFHSLRDIVTPKAGQTVEKAIADLFPKISDRTVYRRWRILKCAPAVQEARRNRQITLAQTDAFSVGPHERQEKLLREYLATKGDAGIEDLTPGEIAAEMIGDVELPTEEWARFDLSLYTGEMIEDPVTEERLFANVEEAERLQKDAFDKKAEELRATGKFNWVDTCLSPYIDNSKWMTYAVNRADQEAGALLTYGSERDWEGRMELAQELGLPEQPEFDGFRIVYPVLRWKTVEERQKQGQRDRAAATGQPQPTVDPSDIEQIIRRQNPDKPARLPLSVGQINQRHQWMTQALRRAICSPVVSDTKAKDQKLRISLTLSILGMAGVREVRNINSAQGFDPYFSPMQQVQTPLLEQSALEQLVKTAALNLSDQHKPKLHNNGDISIRAFDSAAAAAWFWALMDLSTEDLTDLHARMIAERCGSWLIDERQAGKGMVKLGDSAFTCAIATATGADSYVPDFFRPDRDWFNQYSRDRLAQLVRDNLHLQKTEAMKKGELVDHCLDADKGTWTIDKFVEARFQTEAQATEALTALTAPKGEEPESHPEESAPQPEAAE